MEILIGVLIFICLVLAISFYCGKNKCNYTIEKPKKTEKKRSLKKPKKPKQVVRMKVNKQKETKKDSSDKYYCKKCDRNHMKDSGIGKKHKKYK